MKLRFVVLMLVSCAANAYREPGVWICNNGDLIVNRGAFAGAEGYPLSAVTVKGVMESSTYFAQKGHDLWVVRHKEVQFGEPVAYGLHIHTQSGVGVFSSFEGIGDGVDLACEREL